MWPSLRFLKTKRFYQTSCGFLTSEIWIQMELKEKPALLTHGSKTFPLSRIFPFWKISATSRFKISQQNKRILETKLFVEYRYDRTMPVADPERSFGARVSITKKKASTTLYGPRTFFFFVLDDFWMFISKRVVWSLLLVLVENLYKGI